MACSRMKRTLLLLAITAASLAACKDSASARPEPVAMTSALPGPAAQMPSAREPSSLSDVQREHLRRADESACAALRARDGAKLKAIGAPTLDVGGTLQTVLASECLGDVMQATGTDAELLVRHTLGFLPTPDGGRCEGVHEIHMHYALINGEPRLLSVNRWGW